LSLEPSKPDATAALEAAFLRLKAFLEGHGLPPGAAVDAIWAARKLAISEEDAHCILAQLMAAGLVEETAAGGLCVATDVARQRRNLSARIAPTLVAMAQLAAAAASEADIAGLLAARNRMDSAIAAMDSVARATAYRDVITRLAAATGNRFYRLAAAQLLDEAGDMIDALTAIDLKIYTSDSRGGEMLRMVQAIAARNPILAGQAAQDHALIVTMRLDKL